MHLSSGSPPPNHRPYDLSRILAGDETELEYWFESEVDSLQAFIRYAIPSHLDLSADIAQDTFAHALNRLQDFNPARGSMRNWLRSLSRNIIRDTLRVHQRQMSLEALSPSSPLRLALVQIADEDLPDDALTREETRELVLATLARLTTAQRRLLQAKYIDEQSLASLAKARGTTTDAIKSSLRRARASFREMFLALLSCPEP